MSLSWGRPSIPGLLLFLALLAGPSAEFPALAEDKPPAAPGRDAAKGPADAAVERLLAKLKEQNAGQELFKDEWCRTLKEIVDLGPDAVPGLVRELDATDNNMMLRCLGFTLRAIGDKRAVPALIRAIPKTLMPPGSDMGLRAEDPELAAFAQKYDLDERHQGKEYGFGRPVREICGALEALTGQDLGEDDLFHVMLEGSPSQQQLRRRLYRRVAEQWAEWWDQSGKEHVGEHRFVAVGLPLFEDAEDIPPPSPDSWFKTDGAGGHRGWFLESVLAPKATFVFYDFDIGRVGGLPAKWRNLERDEIAKRQDEIAFWAVREGFDLMGTEYETKEGKKVYALRSLGMHAWELEQNLWKTAFSDTTLKQLQEQGRPAGKFLFHQTGEGDEVAPRERATFLFVTRHGTPGILFVGVEILDDTLKPGGVIMGDTELDPVGFRKGRRFAYDPLMPVKP